MTSIAYSAVNIQISARSVPTPPRWFGELTLIVHHLRRQGVLAAIEEQVRLARRRFGHYDVIDFVALLFGYAISGERTLEAFYEQVQPWASAFMALFGRDRLRTLFLDDLLARPLTTEQHPEGLSDRHGKHFLVFDVDGTREAARQRALPHTDEDRPAPVRRLRPLCAPGYTGNGQYRVELRQALACIQRYVQSAHLPTSCALVRLDGQYGTKAVLCDL